jgi:nitric oxide reductase subunit C
MAQYLSKAGARNIFIGGTVFFVVVFLGLTVHFHTVLPERSNAAQITPAVERGKRIWEEHACIDCHTILGEGAYYAPELANVWERYGGDENPQAARSALKSWMRSQPTGAPGRRQMPHFDLSESELNDLVAFLRWTSQVETAWDWPPNKQG